MPRGWWRRRRPDRLPSLPSRGCGSAEPRCSARQGHHERLATAGPSPVQSHRHATSTHARGRPRKLLGASLVWPSSCSTEHNSRRFQPARQTSPGAARSAEHRCLAGSGLRPSTASSPPGRDRARRPTATSARSTASRTGCRRWRYQGRRGRGRRSPAQVGGETTSGVRGRPSARTKRRRAPPNRRTWPRRHRPVTRPGSRGG